jgi:hypothetical protein
LRPSFWAAVVWVVDGVIAAIEALAPIYAPTGRRRLRIDWL